MVQKRKYLILLVIVLCVFAAIFYFVSAAQKPYVYLDGGYYYLTPGEISNESFLGEQKGEILRNRPRTFWNRDGDSNIADVGAKIYIPTMNPNGDEAGECVLVESSYPIPCYFIYEKES